MRYPRAFCFILSVLAFVTSCSAGKSPTYHGVQGSYEASSLTPASTLKPLIILDPGHGGMDEGAKINTFMEKKIALTAALLTKKHLEKLGYRVIMTRNRDVFLPLPRRVSIANKTKGSLFVSVHFNSSPSVEAQGIEIFYYDSKEMWRTRASKRLANCILYGVVDQTEAVSRGIKQGNFHVIRETEIPAVLVEGGFMTNKEERAKLRDRAYLDRLAIGIAQGIDKYMKM
jgi:N-acetylmuramoyl-L-alanine amidase